MSEISYKKYRLDKEKRIIAESVRQESKKFESLIGLLKVNELTDKKEKIIVTKESVKYEKFLRFDKECTIYLLNFMS